MSDDDDQNLHLVQAFAQAELALFVSPPNPAVGCVVVSPIGKIIGQGHTQATGASHAEVMALRDVLANAESAVGATAYVTLEPCSHFGRTPPCCHALIDAKVAKVVIALLDPNPLVAGKGVAMLRAAGIEVEVLDAVHPQALAAKELMLGFFSRMVRKTPWVRVKIAASLDGKTALNNGQSQWITSPAARDDGHFWRARAGAILTGVGTVLADDPLLNVRVSTNDNTSTSRQPPLVIVDSQLRTPVDAKLFAINSIAPQAINAQARVIFIYTNSSDTAKIAALEAKGATVIQLPTDDENVLVNLSAMLQDLAQREVNELHVEAGATLNGALMAAGLVDEYLVYLAPKLLGPGRSMLEVPALNDLNKTLPLEFKSVTTVGDDIRLLLRVSGRDKF
jgi:diaminohydroxyphosphoribosylaminopyrimidine deaminase/5-amino-6-(5-phosphoribosylamino)uracil reductase